MKKALIIFIILLTVIFLVWMHKDTLNLESVFTIDEGVASDDGIDAALIHAIAHGDAQKVDAILSTTSTGKSDFVPMLKFYAPEVTVHDLFGVNKLYLLTQLQCERMNFEREAWDALAQNLSEFALDEAKKYSACEDEIMSFYVTTALCQTKNEDCSSAKYLYSSEREEALTKIGQSNYDCITKHFGDIEKKNACIRAHRSEAPEQLAKEMASYCDVAVSCHVFDKVSTCLDKYRGLLASDKVDDCKMLHADALAVEMNIVNRMIKVTECEAVKDYEEVVHVEELFEEAGSIKKYNNLLYEEINRPVEDIRFHQNVVMYQTSVCKIEVPQDYMTNWAYYSACRMKQLPLKK